MKTLKQIKEQIAMSVGAGGIAGLPPDLPPVPAGVTTAMTGNMLRRKSPINSKVKKFKNWTNK